MSRALAALDRMLLFVLGAVALVLGVGAVVWDAKWWDRLTGTVRAPWLRSAAEQDWWPWAVGAAGVLLALLALWWLRTHLSRHKIGETRLSGSSTAGKLTVDLNALVSAAADAVLDTPGVRSANGKAVTDRGRRTLQLTMTIEPTADLPTITIEPTADLSTITAATDHVCHDLTRALGDPDIATRVHLHTARTTHSGPRVS